MKKIVITGPESSGKSTLAAQLAKHYNADYTMEQSRLYLNGLARPYVFDDLEKIASLQIDAEDDYLSKGTNVLFCDTDLITIKIWSEYKYGKVSTNVLQWINNRQYDLYLLCKPDLPWEPDPLRENPNDRQELFDIHVDELIHYHKTFEFIEGTGDKRLELAIQHVEKFKRFWK